MPRRRPSPVHVDTDSQGRPLRPERTTNAGRGAASAAKTAAAIKALADRQDALDERLYSLSRAVTTNANVFNDHFMPQLNRDLQVLRAAIDKR
jgi:hypothetical protein